jgi:2-oxoglutarate dehydrogenase E1 component
MAHRGRINALYSIFKESKENILGCLHSKVQLETNVYEFTDDVLYHRGKKTKFDIDGKKLNAYFLNNPSHLEAINPVVLGHTR